MATLKQMLDFNNNNIYEAESMARNFIETLGDEYLLDLSLLYSAQGKKKEAHKICAKVLHEQPDQQIRAAYNIGNHIVGDDLQSGFELIDKGRTERIWGDVLLPRFQMPLLETIPKNKHILLYCEGGFGDEVIFIRFARELSVNGNKVIVACSPELMSIFARIPEVSAVISKDNSNPNIYFDYYIPAMSVILPLKLSYKDINKKSYLKENSAYKNKFADFIKSDKCRVGICWHGRVGDDYINRVFPEEPFFDAVSQDVQLYSLQKEKNGVTLPEHIIDCSDKLETWEDTMGIISHLDLVVTSCTAIAHFAGAMGKAVFVVIPVMPYFIWAHQGNKSLWYENVTLFRQTKYGEWDFNNLADKISEFKRAGKWA